MTSPPAPTGDTGSRGGRGGSGTRGEPMRVLVVTDQPVLADLIGLTLNHGNFAIRAVDSVDAAAAALEQGEWHLVALDMDVEALGPERVMERLGCVGDADQHAHAGDAGDPGDGGNGMMRVPMIALTRRGDLKTKLAAFDRGVDDILTVPFSPEELLARALAIVRRTYQAAVALAPVVRVGELEIDIYHRKVRAGSSELHLTPLEQQLLYLLAANAGRLLTRDEILDHLWGTDHIADSNVVDRHIRNLRAKLQDDWRRPRYVATVPGRGYRFLPVTDAVVEAGAGDAG